MSGVSSLAVFCGSRHGDDPAYREAAIRLGVELARRGIRLVYGGGSIGLMGILADTVLAEGGEVIGIIPDFLLKHEVGHRRLTRMIVTSSMHDRKRRMFEMADAFAILPGGLGTLDETLEIVTWKQLRLHDKPIVIINVNGYWAALAALVAVVIDGGFAHPAVAGLITIVDRPDDIFAAIAAAPPAREEVLTSHL